MHEKISSLIRGRQNVIECNFLLMILGPGIEQRRNPVAILRHVLSKS